MLLSHLCLFHYSSNCFLSILDLYSPEIALLILHSSCYSTKAYLSSSFIIEGPLQAWLPYLFYSYSLRTNNLCWPQSSTSLPSSYYNSPSHCCISIVLSNYLLCTSLYGTAPSANSWFPTPPQTDRPHTICQCANMYSRIRERHNLLAVPYQGYRLLPHR